MFLNDNYPLNTSANISNSMIKTLINMMPGIFMLL